MTAWSMVLSCVLTIPDIRVFNEVCFVCGSHWVSVQFCRQSVSFRVDTLIFRLLAATQDTRVIFQTPFTLTTFQRHSFAE